MLNTTFQRGKESLRPKLFLASAVLFGAVLVTGSLFVYCQVFSTFWDGDDEGYLMITSRFFLDGHALYDDFRMVYGPFYQAARWLPFGLLRLPLTNDTVRLLTCCAWVGCAGLLAATVLRLARGRRDRFWLAAACAAMAFVLLRGVKFSPGHAQELVVLGVALALLVAASFSEEKHTARLWAALGAIGAALILTKVNVGVFFLLACTLTLVTQAPQGKAWSALKWSAVAASLALPAVIMCGQLDYLWVQGLCFRTVLSLTLCLWLALGRSAEKPCGIREYAWFGLGIAATTVVSLAFVTARGTSWFAMVDCLVIGPMSLVPIGLSSLDLSMKPGVAFAAVVSAALAISSIYAKGRFRDFLNDHLLGWAKLGVVAIGRRAIINDAGILIQYGPLFCWLALMVPRNRQASSGELLFRRLICFLAVFQSLQVYPVAGDSQIDVGSVALLPLGALFLIDWIECVRFAHARLGAALAGLGSAGVGLLSLKALAILTVHSVAYFQEYEQVTFPGCRLMRMPEEQLAIYRCLVENIRPADAFVSRIGSNSLYFWTERQPIDLMVSGWSWKTIPDESQQRLIDKYRKAGDVLAIDHPGALERSAWKKTRFGRFIQSEFRPVAKVGSYTLLRRADLPEKPFVYGATSEPGQQVERDRITTADGVPLKFHLVLPDAELLGQVAEGVVLIPRHDDDLVGPEPCERLPGVVLLSDGAQLDAGAGDSAQVAPVAERRVGLVVKQVKASPTAWHPVLRLYDSAGQRLLTVPIALRDVCLVTCPTATERLAGSAKP